MASWSDLFTYSTKPLPRQVFLSVGEVSSLVLDKVHEEAMGFDARVKVDSPEAFSILPPTSGKGVAFVLVNPSEEVLEAAASFIRGGGYGSVYLALPDLPKTEAAEFLKKRAQTSKKYFTVTPPKAESAQDRMVTFFQMRWGVTRDACWRVCSVEGFSPSRLYLFDSQLRRATGGQVLPSSQSNEIISELIGTDTPTTVGAALLEGRRVETALSPDSSRQVLTALLNLVLFAKSVRMARETGATSVADVSKDTGLTQYQVVQAWGLSDSTSMHLLRSREKILNFGLAHADNPEVLSTVSQLWLGE